MTYQRDDEDDAQSVVTVADVAMACVVALVLWFTLGAVAMIIGLFWMCG